MKTEFDASHLLAYTVAVRANPGDKLTLVAQNDVGDVIEITGFDGRIHQLLQRWVAGVQMSERGV